MEFGFTATCYFVSRAFGSYNFWDLDKDVERKPIMSWTQAAEWVRAGMEAGSHTCNHRRMTQCSRDTRHFELMHSKHELEQTLGTRIDSFSYPYGNYDLDLVAHVHTAGYGSAVTTRGGRMPRKGDLFRMNRIAATDSSPVRFVAEVATDYRSWLEGSQS